MRRSQNGWPAGPSPAALGVKVYTVPGTDGVKIAVQKDWAPIALYHGREWNRRVEKLKAGWCWGYAWRVIRGAVSTISNHGSGSAWDWNAPLHPLGKAGTLHGKAGLVRAINRECGVVRGGLDYQSRPDEMHTEGAAGTDVAEVLAAAARLSRPKVPQKDRGPTGPFPLRPGHVFGVRTAGAGHVHDGDGSKRVAAAVRQIQREVGTSDASGHYGGGTELRVKTWQRQHGLKADGVVGAHTWTSMRNN
jgi:peptidoglycan hydrolase-like protein with peptidoglycan-binding domain